MTKYEYTHPSWPEPKRVNDPGKTPVQFGRGWLGLQTDADLQRFGITKTPLSPPPPPPPPPPPSTDPVDYPLTRRQFKAMVYQLDIADKITSAISLISDVEQRAEARAAYEEADLYHRSDPLFASLAPHIWPDMTTGERETLIDDAWMQAKDKPA